MNAFNQQKALTLLQREVLEYRNSLLLAPALICGGLLLLMLISVFLTNRVALIGAAAVEVLIDEQNRGGISISIGREKKIDSGDLIISTESDNTAGGDDWDFGKDWTFQPKSPQRLKHKLAEKIDSLNPILNALHILFFAVLLMVTAHYLLSCFHQDRGDRSVLFWKSMPVSEREEIGAKMATACLVAPAIYIAISFVTQIAYAILAMLLVWRLDMNPNQVILENINFISLFSRQLGGWLVWILWTAPLYTWLLLCSAAARRSPLMLAIAVPIALVIIESVFFGSDYITLSIARHLPYFVGEKEVGLQDLSTDWAHLDYSGMALGLVLAGCMLAATHWLRRRRFEL